MLPSILEIRRAYAALFAVVRTRTLFLLGFAVALFLTDVVALATGLIQARTIGEVHPAGIAFFVLSKLVVIIAAYIGFVRLSAAPGLTARAALAIDRRQAKWLGIAFVVLLGLLGIMILLKIAIVALVSILGWSKATAAGLSLIVYIVVELILMARILPGVAGVMIGDPAAGLGWAWTRTRGRISATVLIVVALMLPFELLHIVLTLATRGIAGAPGLALMLLDGLAMALIIAAVGAAHHQLYAYAAAQPGDS